METDLARAISHSIFANHHILNFVQADVFFQHPEICGQRFKCNNPSCGADAPRQQKAVEAAPSTDIKNRHPRMDSFINLPGHFRFPVIVDKLPMEVPSPARKKSL